ncbi:MAG TPA: phospholipase D-like domain-containing protein [Steroidobacteraceae bacterium]|jgi:cardiolipin synthase|nr:phospholipase D-like domain-containing protein [Steroidobacteraceae bacterium]
MSTWLPPVSLHSLVIVVSILTYVLTARAGRDRERRPPSIAIAWVLGMIALPYLVLPMYLMFGRRKLPRKILPPAAARCCTGHWAQELIQSFGLPAASPARTSLHEDGIASADALFAIMTSAVSRLDICTYILGDDAFGRKAMQHMMDRARSGVEVRLLLDGVGALQLPNTYFSALAAGGVETAVFSPLFARRTQGPRNLRNHRKMVIADARRLWAGGRNLAAEYFSGATDATPWRDLTFDLQGPVAAAAASQFESDWVAAGGKPASAEAAAVIAGAAASPGSRACGEAQYLPSGPDQSEDTVHALLIDACFQARERMLAVTPYFVPDVSLETSMRLAARRGVRIDLCIPQSSNHKLADFARNRALRSLSLAGVNVHLLPDMCHAKAVVFDDALGVSGSVNLDSRSLLLNYECAVVFYGRAEIEWLANWIEALIPHTVAFDPRPPSLLRDLCEGLLLTVAYQL